MNINFKQLRDMIILCGCHYTGVIKGIGQIHAYNLIQKYQSIDKIIDFI